MMTQEAPCKKKKGGELKGDEKAIQMFSWQLQFPTWSSLFQMLSFMSAHRTNHWIDSRNALNVAFCTVHSLKAFILVYTASFYDLQLCLLTASTNITDSQRGEKFQIPFLIVQNVPCSGLITCQLVVTWKVMLEISFGLPAKCGLTNHSEAWGGVFTASCVIHTHTHSG